MQCNPAEEMESFGTMSLLDCFNLFPLVTRLLSEKYRRLSYFVYVIYLSALVKLKLKSLKIKAVDIKLFKSLVAENNYNNNFHGDINGCALVSLNTLIALSLRSGSWIRIFKLNNSENKPKLNVPDNQTNVFYHIVMPPVRIASKEWDGSQVNSYLIQCVCVSSVLDDFVLYVSDNKLFNISRMGCKNDEYCDLVNRVGIEIVDVDIFPTVAKSATVSGISSADNIISDDVEYILSQHFKKPRLLRVGDVFHICQKKYFSNLSSDFSCAQDIYFKVGNL